MAGAVPYSNAPRVPHLQHQPQAQSAQANQEAVGTRALNLLITAAYRIPVGVTCLYGAALTGELARRGVVALLGVVGFAESRAGKFLYDLIPDLGKQVLDITRPINTRNLAITAACLNVVGVIGWELGTVLFKDPSPLVNEICKWTTGPVRMLPYNVMRRVQITIDSSGKEVSRSFDLVKSAFVVQRVTLKGDNTVERIQQEYFNDDHSYHHPIIQFGLNAIGLGDARKEPFDAL